MIMKYVENVFEKYTDKETIARIKCFDTIRELWETSVKEFANDVVLADPTRQRYLPMIILTISVV